LGKSKSRLTQRAGPKSGYPGKQTQTGGKAQRKGGKLMKQQHLARLLKNAGFKFAKVDAAGQIAAVKFYHSGINIRMVSQ